MKSLNRRGFTLVELLVSTAIITLLTLILVSITNQTNNVWRYTTGKAEQFRGARNAFDTVTNRLSQATLNTYWDYNDPKAPARYERRSELRFVSGRKSVSTGEALLGDANGAKRVSHSVFFHAPLGFVQQGAGQRSKYNGLSNLLNVWGYYVELDDDDGTRPSFINTLNPPVPLRKRFRLMEFMQPAEQLQSYSFTSGTVAAATNNEDYKKLEWFKPIVNNTDAPVHVLSENIIALILLPQLTKQDREDVIKQGGGGVLAPKYDYDSTSIGDAGVGAVDRKYIDTRNQLPPIIQVTLVAIDEQSALRMSDADQSQLRDLIEGQFERAVDFEKDLNLDSSNNNASLENKLVAMKANYRVFTTNVPIRSAKWSREQSK